MFRQMTTTPLKILGGGGRWGWWYMTRTHISFVKYRCRPNLHHKMGGKMWGTDGKSLGCRHGQLLKTWDLTMRSSLMAWLDVLATSAFNCLQNWTTLRLIYTYAQSRIKGGAKGVMPLPEPLRGVKPPDI